MPGSCSRVIEQGSHPGTGTLLGREVHRSNSISYLSDFSYSPLLPRGLGFSLRVLFCPSPSSRHSFSGARYVEYFLVSTGVVNCGPPNTCQFYLEADALSPQAVY